MPGGAPDDTRVVSEVRPHLEFLAAAQNADGGWGYFAGKQSWLEPTAYAMLALHGQPPAERAWNLLRAWQLPSGAWRPAAGVTEESWATSLAVTLHVVRGVHDEALRRGVDWLLNTRGAEGGFLITNVLDRVRTPEIEQNTALKGWPWRAGNASWVEPTAHALVALRKAAHAVPSEALEVRAGMATRMLFDRRCRDGGWNYGNRRVLATDLESYPESTAIALLGLQGAAAKQLRPSIERALTFLRGGPGPLALAWLAIALRLHAVLPEEPKLISGARGDVMLAALAAIGAKNGTWALLKTEAV